MRMVHGEEYIDGDLKIPEYLSYLYKVYREMPQADRNISGLSNYNSHKSRTDRAISGLSN